MVGSDDWAYKRGQKYGTILVDLEQHRVIDLLPDRTAETVAAWLKNQPTIEVVSRDRAGAYADAARQGAPQAQQVADRGHLLQNLTEAVQRVVERHYVRLREIVQEGAGFPPEQAERAETIKECFASELFRRGCCGEHGRTKAARCVEVLRLHAQGLPILLIARQLRMHRRLVRQYIQAGVLPRAIASGRRHQLHPYASYVAQR